MAEQLPSRRLQLLMLQEAGSAHSSASPSSLAAARYTASSPPCPPDGCGGQSLAFQEIIALLQVILPDGYLAAVYEEMRAEGAACIADEVHLTFFASFSLISEFQQVPARPQLTAPCCAGASRVWQGGVPFLGI